MLAPLTDVRLDGQNMGEFAKLVATSVMLFSALGCQALTTRKTETPVVDNEAKPKMGVERTTTAMVVHEVGEDSHLQVSVTKNTMCQKTKTTPRKMIIREENELGGSDLLWSIVGAGLGGVSIGVGVVNVAAPCEFSDDPECNKDRTKGAGGALIGIGAALFIPLIVNGVRAVDTEEEGPADAVVSKEGKPQECGKEPYAGAKIVIRAVGSAVRYDKLRGQLNAALRDEETKKKLGLEGSLVLGHAVADDDGRAEFDLRNAKWAPFHTKVAILVGGEEAGAVPTAEVPSFAAMAEVRQPTHASCCTWREATYNRIGEARSLCESKKTEEACEAAVEKAVEWKDGCESCGHCAKAQEEIFLTRHNASRVLLPKYMWACDDGEVDGCVNAATFMRDYDLMTNTLAPETVVYFEKACKLGNKRSCGAAKAIGQETRQAAAREETAGGGDAANKGECGKRCDYNARSCKQACGPLPSCMEDCVRARAACMDRCG